MSTIEGVEGDGSGRRGLRVVLTTFGSLGDLHPYLAIAIVLKNRGFDVVMATSELYRERIEALGLGFRAIRPDLESQFDDPETFRKAMDLRTGSEFVIKELMMPHLRDSFDDLMDATEGADVLISHMITFTAPMVAEIKKIRWLSTFLAPMSLISAYDPPVPPARPALKYLRLLGPGIVEAMFRSLKPKIRWADRVREFRKELGLPDVGHPIFEGQNSPYGSLALFSKVLGAPQPDWPEKTQQTGFPFFDKAVGQDLPPELARFLDAGPAPLVFTLGSSAVNDAGRFFEDSRAAAERLKQRAVFLIGKDPRNQFSRPLPATMIACEYAPFSELFSRASVVVHQGGVGTTAQGLRAGRPTLVVPWSHDQPDNAERVRRLGVSKTLPRASYHARSAARALEALLNTASYQERAREVGAIVQSENGAEAAAEAIARFAASA